MATVAHAEKSLAVVGAGGHEDNFGAFLGGGPCELGTLDVVADQDGDLAVGRLEYIEDVTMVAVPFFLFPARAVDLVLQVHFAPRREQEGGVEQLPVADVRVRTTDQVIAVAHGMCAE